MFKEIENLVPKGWYWTLYSSVNRAVLVSPDMKIHIGREAKTLEQALRDACRAARNGEKS